MKQELSYLGWDCQVRKDKNETPGKILTSEPSGTICDLLLPVSCVYFHSLLDSVHWQPWEWMPTRKMCLGEELWKVKCPELTVLTYEATSLTSKGRIISDISPQACTAKVPSKLGHQEEPVISQCHLIKVPMKGAGRSHSKEDHPSEIPTSNWKPIRWTRVNEGTDIPPLRQLWSHPLSKQASPLSCAHTGLLCYHPHFYLYHPEETLEGMTPSYRGWRGGQWGWRPGVRHRGLWCWLPTATESWCWKGLNQGWTGIKFFFKGNIYDRKSG